MTDRRHWRGVRVSTIVLGFLCALLSARVAVDAIGFVRYGLQMDFAAFWTAGRASAAGLSPYENHFDRTPPIWDGIASYRHSRFLYPPPAATLFSAISSLSYPQAKALWTMLIALSVAAAALFSQAWFDPQATFVRRCCFALIVVGFQPLLALFERGQVDGLVLLFVVLMLGTLASRRTEWIGGALFALVVLLKLHLVLAVPLLFYRRRRALGGLVAAGAALLACALLFEGESAVMEYFGQQLPRIARFGESGPARSRIPPERMAALRGELTPDTVALDGRTWRMEMLEFTINASLVRTPIGRAAWEACRAFDWKLAPGQIGLVLFLAGVGLYLPIRRRIVGRKPLPDTPAAIGRSGLAAITWAQLVAPLGWSMGTVLLLPAAPLALRALSGPCSSRARLGSWLILIGLIVAAVADPLLRILLPASTPRIFGSEYIVAQLLVLSGLLLSRAD